MLLAIVGLLKYHKLIAVKVFFDPLAGGNGKVQMNEAAKGLILVLFCLLLYVEAKRPTEAHIFDKEIFYAMLAAVMGIAGLQLHYGNKNGPKKEPEQ